MTSANAHIVGSAALVYDLASWITNRRRAEAMPALEIVIDEPGARLVLSQEPRSKWKDRVHRALGAMNRRRGPMIVATIDHLEASPGRLEITTVNPCRQVLA